MNAQMKKVMDERMARHEAGTFSKYFVLQPDWSARAKGESKYDVREVLVPNRHANPDLQVRSWPVAEQVFYYGQNDFTFGLPNVQRSVSMDDIVILNKEIEGKLKFAIVVGIGFESIGWDDLENSAKEAIYKLWAEQTQFNIERTV